MHLGVGVRPGGANQANVVGASLDCFVKKFKRLNHRFDCFRLLFVESTGVWLKTIVLEALG